MRKFKHMRKSTQMLMLLMLLCAVDQSRTPVMASSVDNTTIQTISTTQEGESNKKSAVKDSIELKEVTKETVYHIKEDGSVEEISMLDITDGIPEDMSNYYAVIEMEDLPSFYAKIKEFRKENKKLVAVIEQKDLVQYAKDGSKTTGSYKFAISYKDSKGEHGIVKDATEFFKEVAANLGGTYTLTEDLDASNISADQAAILGTFTGKINGNGHKILNLKTPLFQKVNGATIENLVIENATITSSVKGILANSIENKSTINNTFIVNSSLKNNTNQMGAFAGVLNNSTIKNSAAINISIKGNNTIGGMIGQTNSGSVIENSYVTGTIEGTIYHDLGARIGGITGWHSGASIDHCFTNVTIKAPSKTGNGGLIGGPNGANPKITYSFSIANGSTNKIAGFNVLANAKEVYEYKDANGTTNINANNQDKVKEVSDIYTKSFYTDVLKLDESVWNLDLVDNGKLPSLKADPLPNTLVDYEIQENKNNIPNYKEVRNQEAYMEANEVAYANIAKLMPFASTEDWVSYGNKVGTSSSIHSKKIQYVLPLDKNGALVTGVEKQDSDVVTKILLVYEDGENEGLSVQYKNLVGDVVATYETTVGDLQYQFHNYVVDVNEDLKQEVLTLAKSYDYATDIASLTSETESRLYTDYYNENVKSDLENVITKYILSQASSSSSLDNEAVQKQWKDKLLNETNVKKFLYAFNYYNKWYNINFNGVNLSDLIFFNGELLNQNMTREKLTNQLLSASQTLRGTASTYDFYQQVLKPYTGKEMMEFIADMAKQVAGYENPSDWFVAEFDGILKEQPIVGKEDTINYRIWDILSNLASRKKIVLPMLTAPQEDMYLISMPSQLVIGSLNRYPQYVNKDGKEREKMKQAINNYAERLEHFYGVSSNWISNSEKLLNSFVNIQYDTRFSFPSSDKADAGTQNAGTTKDPVMKWVYEAIGSFGAANGSAAYANGTDVYWIVEGALGGEYAFSVFSHETAHNQDGRYFYAGNGRRSGTGPEAHADGNIAQQIGDGSMVFNISTIKDIASDITNNFSYERIDTAEKVHSYYKEMFETGYVLDYLEGQAFLQLTPEQQSKIAIQVSEQKDGTSLKVTYKKLSAEDFEAMNLQTMEDLWNNKIALKTAGTFSSSSYGNYGYESFYDVNWYQVHNDEGSPDSSSFKRLAQEMLGIGGYENGYMTYISGKSKNDLDALRKITGQDDITWKSYKLGRYDEVKENLDKIPYFNADEVITQFKKAFEQDAQEGTGKRNNSISVKRTLYGIVKRATDDFSNGSVYETPEVIGVDSAQQLIELVKQNPAGYYQLTTDIDFTGISAQDGAYITSRFIGVLDGNGHSITGMKYTLFNQMLYAQVKNLKIVNPSYESEATAYLAKNSKNVTIDTVTVDGSDMTLPFVKTKTGTYYEYGTVGAEVRDIEIYSVEDFLAIGSSEAAKKKSYKLMTDLDFADVNTSNFAISGTFTGKIDGNGFVISNLNSTIFEKLQNATITNLGISDSRLTKANQKGMLANSIDNSVIEKVYMRNISLSNDTNQVGGVAGLISKSTVREVSLENINIKSNNTIGGIAGQIDNSKVENSLVTGRIQGTIYHNLGARIGGITGWVGTGTTLANVYTKVQIVAPQAVGNGGLIGGPSSGNVSITNAIALTTGTSAKRIAGWNVLNQADNVYEYTGSNSVTNITDANKENVKVASEEQVKAESFYTENLGWSTDIWDFSNVEAGETPRLRSMLNVFVEDTEAPVIAGVDNDGIYTSAVTPVITDEHLKSVTILKDGVEFIYEDGMTLTEDGQYEIVATDRKNNETSVKFIIDTAAPTIEVSLDSQDKFWETYNLSFKDTLSGIAEVKWDIDKKQVEDFNRPTAVIEVKDEKGFSESITLYKNSTYTFYVKDKAGNEDVYVLNTSNLVMSDKTAPVIAGVENNGVYTEAVIPVITDENLSLVTILKDGSKISYEEGMTLTEDGEYTIIAMDNGNNKTTITFTIKTTVDSTEEKTDKEETSNTEEATNTEGASDVEETPSAEETTDKEEPSDAEETPNTEVDSESQDNSAGITEIIEAK